MDMNLSKLQELVMDKEAWRAAVHVVAELNWTVMQDIPTGYLFYISLCICFHAALSVLPTLSFPHCVHKCVLFCKYF